MPQMMPMNWMFMFIQLSTIILMMTILLFFLIIPTPPHHKLTSKLPQISWKW